MGIDRSTVDAVFAGSLAQFNSAVCCFEPCTVKLQGLAVSEVKSSGTDSVRRAAAHPFLLSLMCQRLQKRGNGMGRPSRSTVQAHTQCTGSFALEASMAGCICFT